MKITLTFFSSSFNLRHINRKQKVNVDEDSNDSDLDKRLPFGVRGARSSCEHHFGVTR